MKVSLDEKTAALNSAMNEISSVNAEKETLKGHLNQSQQRCKVTEASLTAVQIELNGLKEKVASMESEAAKGRKSNDKWSADMTRLQSLVEELQKGQTNSDNQLKSYKVEVERLKKENSILFHDSKENSKLNAELKALKSELDTSRQDLRVSEAAKVKCTDEIASLRRMMVELEQLLAGANHQLSSAGERVQHLGEENDRLRHIISQLEHSVRSSSGSGEFRRYVEIKEEKASLEKSLTDAKRDNQRLLKAVKQKASGVSNSRMVVPGASSMLK